MSVIWREKNEVSDLCVFQLFVSRSCKHRVAIHLPRFRGLKLTKVRQRGGYGPYSRNPLTPFQGIETRPVVTS